MVLTGNSISGCVSSSPEFAQFHTRCPETNCIEKWLDPTVAMRMAKLARLQFRLNASVYCTFDPRHLYSASVFYMWDTNNVVKLACVTSHHISRCSFCGFDQRGLKLTSSIQVGLTLSC